MPETSCSPYKLNEVYCVYAYDEIKLLKVISKWLKENNYSPSSINIISYKDDEVDLYCYEATIVLSGIWTSTRSERKEKIKRNLRSVGDKLTR